MSKKKSRFNTKGGSGLGWDDIDRFAVRRPRREMPSKLIRRRAEADALAHAADKRRQREQTGTNWGLVDRLLKATKGLSLADAISTASALESL